ncbi:MAG TPA: hypothetical protein PKE29_11180 [Phycisphaerales bacterium]|nr:hypothetical protein [Phycisphaerales bacterium]
MTPRQHTRPARLNPLALALGVAAIIALPSLAPADEYTDRANHLANDAAVADAFRSDLVVLPALADMDRPPAVLRTQDRAALLGNQGPGWAECAEWAQKPNQKKVLEALDKVTKEEDRRKAFAFGQPYGVEGVSVELISKEMYTDLGDPPLLAAAKVLYMPAMENAGILCHVEASRAFAAGDAKAAMKVLVDWLYFCRQMADRPLMQEKKWAMESMRTALERIRDLAYLDLGADKHILDPGILRTVNDRLTDGKRGKKGFLQLDRMRMPEADFIAREQLVKKVMDADGRPSEATFAAFMARAGATQRPLRLFSAAAFWEQARAGHAGERDTLRMLQGLHDDWARRWDLPPFDRYVVTASDYRKYVQTSTRYAVLNEAFRDFDAIVSLRQQIKCELAGTRMSVGAYAYFLRYKAFPSGLAACNPDYIDGIDKDPYSPPPRSADLSYFVPSRDTPKDSEGRPRPYTINLYPPPPAPEFSLAMDDRVFVIFSVGPDGLSDMVSYATQTRTGVRGDYLLFPPTISLYRQRLAEKDELK